MFDERDDEGLERSYWRRGEAPPEDPGAVLVEPYQLREERAIPRRPWIVRDFLLRGHLTALYAAGGVGKSVFALIIGMHVAAGRKEFGKVAIQRRAKVAVLSVEEDDDELDRRLAGIALTYGIVQPEIDEWFYRIRIKAPALLAWIKDPRKSHLEATAKFTELLKQLKALGIEVVILDPIIELWEGEENNNMHIRAFASQLRDDLARELNMAVLITHHVRKGTVTPGDVDAGRGGGALSNTTRIGHTMTAMTAEMAAMLGVDEHRDKIRVDRGKGSYSANATYAYWFIWHTVTLDNAEGDEPGDQVGVLKPWSPPGLFSGIDSVQINELLDVIAAGIGPPEERERYTMSTRAVERCIIPLAADILGVDPPKAKEILKLWLKTKLLTEIDYISPAQRKTRKGLFVTESKRQNATRGVYD